MAPVAPIRRAALDLSRFHNLRSLLEFRRLSVDGVLRPAPNGFAVAADSLQPFQEKAIRLSAFE